jgi:hypothetical protein
MQIRLPAADIRYADKYDELFRREEVFKQFEQNVEMALKSRSERRRNNRCR